LNTEATNRTPQQSNSQAEDPSIRTFNHLPIFLAVLVVVSYAGYFSRLNAMGLVGPDEPRYASIARAMERTGDWVTPRLNGVPWFEKPALYYWTAGASFRLFGENDFAARLPSALAALLAAAAIAWFAWRFYGAAAGLLALLMAPSSIATVAFARAATPDMLFTAMLAMAMVFGAMLVFAEKPDIWQTVGFGVFLGAATLAKGPAAVALAGGSVTLWALISRKWFRALRLAHLLAIIAFILTAVPWYVLCARRNPDFLATFLLLHNFERFLTPIFHHVQPWWFFFPILVLTILPWSALLFALGRDATLAKRARNWAGRPSLYFGCWIVFTLVFFSVSKSKLPGYILPAVPPLLLLLAEAAARLRCRNDDAARGVAMGMGATWLALLVVAGVWLYRQPASSPLSQLPQLWYWIAATAAGGAVVAVLGSIRRMTAALLLNAGIIAALLVVANWVLLPRMDPGLSARATAKAFLAGEQSPGKSFSGALGIYRLDRAWEFGLEYYLNLDHSLQEWAPEEGGSFLLFTTEAGCRDIQRRGMRCDPVQETSSRAWLVRVAVQAPGSAP
jgi:4-amino-4-deoxy-L-arabinose transferase-like glycosyltransferase